VLDNAPQIYASRQSPVAGGLDDGRGYEPSKVADQGPGLPPGEEHSASLISFIGRSGLGAASGAGLGLTICRGIWRRNGGQIWAENRPVVGRLALHPPAGGHAASHGNGNWRRPVPTVSAQGALRGARTPYHADHFTGEDAGRSLFHEAGCWR